MPITPMETPPSRKDTASFAARADKFLGALPAFVEEANALAAAVNISEAKTGADAQASAADRAQTGQDRAATSADKAQTGQDRAATSADRAQTGQDRSASAASADAAAESASSAETARANAAVKSAAASTAAENATDRASAAAASAAASAASAAAALGDKNAAAVSATQASGSATNAANAAGSASDSANAAALAADAATRRASEAAASAESIAGGPVADVAGLTGSVSSGQLKAALALNKIDNSPDIEKPVSQMQALAIAARYGKDNVLGAVSQAAGVPTGALMEHGVNANGEYWRYAGGMQICIASVPVSVTFDISQGAVYQSGVSYGGTALPANFSATPVGTVEFKSSIGTCWENLGQPASTTAFGIAYLMSSNSSPQTGLMLLTAIGRWYG